MGIAEVAEDDFVIVERMSREIDAHELTLPVESLDGAPGFCFRNRRGGYLHRLYASEERGGCLALLLLVELAVSYERIQEGFALAVLAEVLLAADAEAVETATQSQAFECLAVDIGEIHALGKIEDVLIRAVLQAFCHDGIGGRSSHSLDGGESEAYLAMLVHTEGTVTLVYIRSQGLDVHRLALLHQLGNLGDLRKAAGHQRCHVFGWIVCLEIGSLIGYPRIAGGVRLVEGVGCKLLPVAPDFLEHSRIVAVLLSLLDELRLHRIYDSLLLLTHRLTEGIRLASGEACQLAGKEHHLLLIHRDAVGILEIFLHAGDIIGDGLLAVLAGDEVGDVIHRSRTVEGVHGDEVLENRRLQLTEILLHTRRLELEGSDGLAALVELIGKLIIDRDGIEIYDIARGLLDNLARLLHLGEGLQTQEVHLDESGGLDHVTVVLGYCRLQSREIRVIGGRYRHPVADRVAADDESAGMDTRAADGTLEHTGILDGIALAGVAGVFCLLQLRGIFDGVGKVHLRSVGQTVGNRLAECIRLVQRQLLYARHILDGVLGGHRTVCNNVGTVLVTVLIHYPAQHLASAVVIEVGIDIRQVHTVWVQETLKQQVVLQRVDLGDSQAICHYGTCR